MPRLGLVPALVAMFPLAAAAGRDFRFREVLVLTVAMSAFAGGVFVLRTQVAVSAFQLLVEILHSLELGFGVTIGLLFPLTFYLPPVPSLIMLAGIYYGAQYGGAITSILLNLPGETASAVTCLDGYPMARQGRGGAALAISALGSFLAGCLGTLLIALAGPPLGEWALAFGPAEYFSLMLMGLVGSAVLTQGDAVKGLAMVVVGLLIGLVGTDVNSGVPRYAFDVPELVDGIGFTVIAVGLFAVAEIVTNLGRREPQPVFTGPVVASCRACVISGNPSGRRCAAPEWALSSACCLARGRRSRRSRPTCWKRSSRATLSALAGARSRAWRRRRRRTTPRRRRRSSRRSRSASRAPRS